MEDRTVRSFQEALEKQDGSPPPPETVTGNKGAVLAAQLQEVMKLPAAESAVFKFAHADTLSDKIQEHMHSGDPDLEMHAMDVSAKLISSVVKAQKNQAGNVTINTQINTGNVPIAGTPGNLRPRPAYFSSQSQGPSPRTQASSTQSGDPDATSSASADSSEE